MGDKTKKKQYITSLVDELCGPSTTRSGITATCASNFQASLACVPLRVTDLFFVSVSQGCFSSTLDECVCFCAVSVLSKFTLRRPAVSPLYILSLFRSVRFFSSCLLCLLVPLSCFLHFPQREFESFRFAFFVSRVHPSCNDHVATAGSPGGQVKCDNQSNQSIRIVGNPFCFHPEHASRKI